MPKAIFYLLKGDYRVKGFRASAGHLTMQTPQDPFKRESLRHCWLGQCRVPLVSKVELGSCARCVGLSVRASFQDWLCELAPLGL